MDRRHALKLTSVSAVSILLMPGTSAAMDPVTLTILMGIIGAASSVLAARQNADAIRESALISTESQQRLTQMQIESQRQANLMGASIEKMRQDHAFRLARLQLGDKSVLHEVAYTPDGQLASFAWSDNIDGAGTYIGLSKGKIGVERGKYNGTVSTAETVRFAAGLNRGKNMPVPVDAAYRTTSAEMHDKIRKITALAPTDRIIATRPYSSARTPTSDGWDLATVMYANYNNEVKAAIVARDQLRDS